MKFCLIFLIPLIFSGCKTDMNRNEIADMDFVRVMGIDRKEGFTVSLLFEEKEKSVIKSATAPTVFEAYEEIANENVKPITLAHTKYFVLGLSATGQGTEETVDFITREEKVKTDATVYITESAEQFLSSAEKLSSSLELLSRKPMFFSVKQSNTLTDIFNPETTSLIPVLEIKENTPVPSGYAVMQDMTLKAVSDSDIAVGLNFLGNRVRSGSIFTEYGGMVIYDSKTKIKDDIKIFFKTNIKELKEKCDFSDSKYIDMLTEAQNRYVAELVDKSLNFLNKNNIKYPDKTPDNTAVTVESKITGTFDIE